MFYYHDTKKRSQPGESQRKVVLEMRKVTYLNDSPNPSVAEPVVTYGFETVLEKAVSPDYNEAPKIVEQKTVDNRNPNREVVYTPEDEKHGN